MNNDPPPGYDKIQEDRIRVALRVLEDLLNKRNDARTREDHEELARADRQIPPAMRSIGDAYPDQDRRGHWYRQADEYEKANPDEREHILMPIAKGLGLLIAAPLALAAGIVGGTLFAAGSILYGAGKVVQGLGSLLTGGALR